MKLLKKFLKGALIGSLGQIFIFSVLFVPVFAGRIRQKDEPFFHAYKFAYWNIKEILLIMIAVAAVCWGFKEMLRLEE